MPVKEALVELIPDGEHEQHDAEIGQRAQRQPERDREQRRRDLPVEQGRPQQDAGDDLAEHRRLAEALGRHAEQPGEQNDDRQVGQKQLDFLICHRVPFTLATGTPSAPRPDFTIGHSNAMIFAPTGRNLSATRLNNHRYASPTIQLSTDVPPRHASARPARVRARQYAAVIPAPALMLRAACSARSGSARATTMAISAARAGSLPAAATACSSRGPASAGSARTAIMAPTRACRYPSALLAAIRSPHAGSVRAATMATSASPGASGGRPRMTCSACAGLVRAAARATAPRVSDRADAPPMARARCSASVSICSAWPGSIWASATFTLVSAIAFRSLLLMAPAHCSASVSSCPACSWSIWAAAVSAVVDATSRTVP